MASPWLMRSLSALDGKLAQALLGRSEKGALAERVTQLVTSRQQVVDSVEAERRRMERDLHDGAQQRLVSLAMTLGRAKNRLGDKDPSVRTLIPDVRAGVIASLLLVSVLLGCEATGAPDAYRAQVCGAVADLSGPLPDAGVGSSG